MITKKKLLTTKQREAALKKLRVVAKWLKACNYDLQVFVKKYRFKKKSHSGMSGTIYLSVKKKVVVKTPYLCSHSTPKLAIPTVIIRRDDIGDKDADTIFNQPLAEESKLIERAEDWVRELGDRAPDCHSGNVAWYKGCPVRIDW